MRPLLWIVIGLLLCLPVSAQENGEYRLRVPSAEEYLILLNDVMANDDYTFLQFINLELWFHQPDLSSVPLEILLEAGPYINRTIAWDIDDPETIPGWHSLIFKRWLRETHPDLNTRDIWQFGDYTLSIQPVDFTGDDIPEFAAHLTYQPEDYIEFYEYFVLQQDTSRPESYHRLGGISFWFSSECYFQLSCGGEGELREIRDLTGDGLPEWIVSRGSCSYGICDVSLEIWGWWNEAFINLTETHPIGMLVGSGGGGVATYPPQGDWLFENRDDDPELEVIQIEHLTDNRDCTFSSEQIFQWNELLGQFDAQETFYDYADTPWCELRQAHQAMMQADTQATIQHYERMLTFEPPAELTEVWDYARIRLATAYLLDGQAEDTARILNEVKPIYTIADPMIRSMAEAAVRTFSTNSDGKFLCAALADALSEYNLWDGATSILLDYGQSNDYGISLNYGGGDFSSANAGCDIYRFWARTLDALKKDRTPLKAQLESAGWEIASQFEFDINKDGINEELIWSTLTGSSAIFQWSDDEHIHYSPVNISQPSEHTQLSIVSLPDIGNLLVEISFDDSIECLSDSPKQPGNIEVRRFNDGKLVDASNYFEICSSQTIEDTFPKSGEMYIASPSYETESITLYWNSEQMRFERPTEDYTAALLMESPFVCDRGIYEFCGSLEDPTLALDLIDKALANPPESATSEFFAVFKHYRALALEALGRDEEALAEYVAIYESAPESAWGRLAALHFEVVD